MDMYEIYVEGDPYDIVWADSDFEAIDYFLEDNPNIKNKCVSAYLIEDESEQ